MDADQLIRPARETRRWMIGLSNGHAISFKWSDPGGQYGAYIELHEAKAIVGGFVESLFYVVVNPGCVQWIADIMEEAP